jgi:hypothetical protein
MPSVTNPIPGYIRFKVFRKGSPVFINAGDDAAINTFRQIHHNTDLSQSIGVYTDPNTASESIDPLFFQIKADQWKSVRENALRIGYYMEESAGIPQDCIEFICNGSAVDGSGVTAGSNSGPPDRAADLVGRDDVAADFVHGAGDCDGGLSHPSDVSCTAGKDDGIAGDNGKETKDIVAGTCTRGSGNRPQPDPVSFQADRNPKHAMALEVPSQKKLRRHNADPGTTTQSAEMIVRIPALVFGNVPGPLTSHINFELSRTMVKAGIRHIDTDVYQRHSFLGTLNSLNSAAGCYVISLTFDELLNLTPDRIITLAGSARPEESMIIPRPVPQAMKWFQDLHLQAEKEVNYQQRLLQMVLGRGWEMPPCMARLKRSKSGTKACRFESSRILAWWLAWIGASPSQILNELGSISRGIGDEADVHKFRTILALSAEHPRFAGCHHPLLRQHCPAEKCFLSDLIRECERPHLFPVNQDSKETHV